ncbi:MAG: hypothetical protein FWF02_06510 [Micrococcales bacterium]|nr:hypothetical protein [Micrococcales bacterium]MCL2667343.1 hypothetical protein [Micrococcales bacterium]
MRSAAALVFSSVLVLALVAACDSGEKSDGPPRGGRTADPGAGFGGNGADDGGEFTGGDASCLTGTWVYDLVDKELDYEAHQVRTFTSGGGYTNKTETRFGEMKVPSEVKASYRIEGNEIVLFDGEMTIMGLTGPLTDKDDNPEVRGSFSCSGSTLRLQDPESDNPLTEVYTRK